MAFNPDEYLANSFNPDAYLGAETTPAKPQQEMTLDRGIKAVGTILPSAALGAAKPLLGINQALWKLVGSNRGDYPVEKLNQYQQQLNQAAGPIASKFTSEPASLIGENVLPVGAANKVMGAVGQIPSFGRMLSQNAAIGGATAMANPEQPGLTPSKFAEQKLVHGLEGMAIPAVMTGVGAGVTSALSPKIAPEVRKLAEEGVALTPGQIAGGWLKRLEEKASGYPLVGGSIQEATENSIKSFDKTAFKRVLDPINGKVPNEAGRAGMESVEQQVKHTYNELLPQLHFKATPEFNTKMAELRGLAQNLPHDLGKTFNTDIDQIIAKRMGKNGYMDGISFKEAESELSKNAKDYLTSASAGERKLGEAFKQALVNFRTALHESNPEKAVELAKTNEAFRNLAILRDAASRTGTQEYFTPSQLAAAVKKADFSSGKNKTATGQALMQDLSDTGVSVLNNKIPDSGTVSRAALASPTAWMLGAGLSLPYTKIGQEIMSKGMLNRPESMRKLADALRGTSPYLAGPAVNKALGE
jgi:hypothetical protein